MAHRKVDTGLERAARVAHAVVLFVSGSEPLQNADAVFLRRLTDVDLLKAARERAVALEMTVFLIRRRPHATQLAVCEHGLEQVRCVDGIALRGTRAEDCVDLVDEEDRIWALVERGKQSLKARFEVSAVTRAGEERTQVEGENLRAFEVFGHPALVNAQRQAFGERRLPNAGLADKDRVILASAREDMNGAFKFGAATNHRVEFSGGRLFGEVRGKRFERVGGNAFGFFANTRATIRVHRFAGTRVAGLHDAVRDILKQVETIDFLGAQQDDRVRVGLLVERDEQVANFNFVFFRTGRVVDRMLEHAVKGQGLSAFDDFVVRKLFEVFSKEAFEVLLERLDVAAAALDDVDTGIVVQKREQQVFHRHKRMTPVHRFLVGRLQGQLQLATYSRHFSIALQPCMRRLFSCSLCSLATYSFSTPDRRG